MWEYDNDAEADGCLKICRLHHPYYSMKQSSGAKSNPSTALMQSTTAQELNPPPVVTRGTAPTATVNVQPSPAISELTGAASASSLLLVPTLPSFEEDCCTSAAQGDNGSTVEYADGREEVDSDGDGIRDNDDDDDDEDNELDVTGGDSDNEGEELQYHTHAAEESGEDDGMDDDDNDEECSGKKATPTVLKGSPPGWFPPNPPADFRYEPKYDAPTTEEEIDNPGKWPLYSFIPWYNQSKKEYIGHFTPTGAQVVPADDDGFRVKDGWEFHYNGWTTDDFDDSTYVRSGAVEGNLKPHSRVGFLDVDVLTKHGLTAD